MVIGGSIYMSCGDGPLTVYALNGTTGKRIGRYTHLGQNTIGYNGYPLVIDHGLWYSVETPAGVCVPPGPCYQPIPYITMASQSTGYDQFTIRGWWLATDGPGFVIGSDKMWGPEPSDPGTRLIEIDVTTHKTHEIKWPGGRMQSACGVLWSFNDQQVSSVDPATGSIISTFTVDGDLTYGFADIGGACWLAAGSRFERIGRSGVEYKSPAFGDGATSRAALIVGGRPALSTTTPLIIGQSFWLETGTAAGPVIRRVDPRNWQPVGDYWVLPKGGIYGYGAYDQAEWEIDGWTTLFAAGNYLWVYVVNFADPNEYSYMRRTNLPIGPLS